RASTVFTGWDVYAAPAACHQSVAAECDTGNTVQLEEEITRVWFTNPHVRYRLTVRNEDGSTTDWELQGGNVTNLRRQGWVEDSVRVGDRVSVSGALGRNGAKKLNISQMTTADGRRVPQPAAARGAGAGGRGGAAGGGRGGRGAVNARADVDYAYDASGNSYPFDITGPWRNDYRWRVTVDDLEPKPTPFTAEGRALFEA